MQDHFTSLLERLSRQGFAESQSHFEQSKSALDRSEWESSNAQTRAALESLFNQIAVLRLKTNKTGGKARAALEQAGLLKAREARLVQEFIAVAGGAGSHAGVSNADESLGRFLTSIGIAFMGLSMVPELVRAEDVIIGQLKASPGTRLPTDKETYTFCPACKTRQTLGEAVISRNGTDTVYYCVNGCQPILIIGEPGDAAWPGRGYRLGDHVIRNASDLHLPIIGTPGEVLIPASPAALMTKRPQGE